MSTPNIASSIKARLLNLAHAQKSDFQQLLLRYALERLLYRLQRSPYQDRFVLKGAMLFHLWLGPQDLRVTRDIDLLSFGSSQPEALKKIFIEICQTETDEPDGLDFDLAQLQVERIKEGQKYEGVRATFTALLEKTRIPIQIDIGFGDAVTPAPEEKSFPVILDSFSSPVLLTYPKETVVAEKFQALVSLGIQNTRMEAEGRVA